jgi:hypothetical protein
LVTLLSEAMAPQYPSLNIALEVPMTQTLIVSSLLHTLKIQE